MRTRAWSLDQTVDVIESLGLLDAELGKQSEDQQRDDALRRRTGIVERARRQRGRAAVRRFWLRSAPDRGASAAADAFEIGGDFVADVAAIEIIEARMGRAARVFRRRLPAQGRADLGRLAVDEKRGGESRHVFQAGSCSRVSRA